MKIFKIPKNISAIIFDMDSTLYTNSDYAQSQIDLPIETLAHLKGKTFDEMKNEITSYRKNWADENDGKSISLANTFLAYGISINDSVKWREKLYNPEKYLSEDPRLFSTLEQLESRFTLSVVTNNPVSIAERTLSILGVEDFFQIIIGLDTCGVSKPHEEMFMRAGILSGAVPETCLSIGDRYDIDIALPLELGMGGILVNGVEDVYKLPDLLK